MKILITGGAGFIGTHLARRLLREGCSVTVLDNFSRQVHGDIGSLASDLAGNVELQVGDIRDEATVVRALKGQEIVVHLAAETGTGQSMYEVLRYEDVNVRGTAVLMHCLLNDPIGSVRKVLVASSRAVYGEGKYRCHVDGIVYPKARQLEDMIDGRFEPHCSVCRSECEVVPTTEDSPLQPSSFYGLTKQMQEQTTLLFARALKVSGIALRYQNVYGPGQSLKNPYTGILAIFSNQARANQQVNIFEDGLESRDFVYVDDAVEATWRCIIADNIQSEAVNVGSGQRVPVIGVVREILDFFSSRSRVVISGAFRQGDIRHAVADLQKARELIGFDAKWRFSDGIRSFLAWSVSQELALDHYDFSLQEMRQRGLLHG